MLLIIDSGVLESSSRDNLRIYNIIVVLLCIVEIKLINFNQTNKKKLIKLSVYELFLATYQCLPKEDSKKKEPTPMYFNPIKGLGLACFLKIYKKI